jgi:DinB superfamily
VTVVDAGWVRPEPGWVCPECGFDFDACVPLGISETMREFARRYRVPLTRALPGEDLDALLRVRPSTGGWSALEYACHARDAFILSDYRIAKVLTEDRPSLRKGDRDRVAIERDYNGQEPAFVIDELAGAADRLAARLESVPADGWGRVGVRDDLEMTVDWMARNAVHEGTHHLLDIARVLRVARGRSARRVVS